MLGLFWDFVCVWDCWDLSWGISGNIWGYLCVLSVMLCVCVCSGTLGICMVNVCFVLIVLICGMFGHCWGIVGGL